MARGWAVARLRLRATLRARRASLTLVILVIALTAGSTMAAAAGARRSNTAYERFRHWAHEAELTIGGCECSTKAEIDRVLAQVRAAPFVQDSVRFGFANVVVELPDGTRPSFLAFQAAVDLEDRLGRDLPRAKLLHGRLPEPSAPNEVSVGFLVAERFHVRVGDRFRLQAFDAEGRRFVPTSVRVVGIHTAPGEFPSASGPQGSSLLLTSAFARTFPDLIRPIDDSVLVRLRPGTSREQVEEFVGAVDFNLDVDAAADRAAGIDRTIHVETVALVALAIVVAAVGFTVAAQMLRRHTEMDSQERLAYSALGADRADALRLGLLRGATVGLVGAAMAAAVAIGLAPLFPVGIGRIADPDVGVHADLGVLAVGTGVTLVAVTVLGVATAALDSWSSRRDRRRRGRRPRPWPLPAVRPPVLVGLHYALPGRSDDGRSTSERFPRLSLLSLIAVIVVLAATAVTLASFDHLVSHRSLAGATWQAAVIPPDSEGSGPDQATWLARLRAVPGVAAATTTSWATPGGLLVDGQPVDAQSFGDDGSITPAIRRGRAPAAPGELAIGSASLKQLGVQIGDTVALSLTPDGRSMTGRIVGEAVLASPWFHDFAPGTGAATSASTFLSLGASSREVSGMIAIRYAPGADNLRTFDAVMDTLGSFEAFETADRQGVSGLGRIRLVPVLLLAGLLALVAATVAHLLLLSVAGHRRDLAALRAMGFTRHQSATSVAVQATVLAAGACVVGLPLGVALGRATWDRIASGLVVVSRPIAPVALLILIGVALVIVANLAALLPARRAARQPPATLLRLE